MPPVIGKVEKVIVYAIVIAIDIIQFFIDVLVVDEPLNHIIDVGVGIVLAAYALKRNLLTASKGLVLGATFLAEQIPFVNALPFWTYDVHNLYKGTVNEPIPEVNHDDVPLNSGGVRRPTRESTPLNEKGVRPPRKV